MKLPLITLFFLLLAPHAMAQHLYWIQYNHKSTPLHEVTQYFDRQAIVNRAQANIPWDQRDLPIDAEHKLWAASQGKVLLHSRWFNASVVATKQDLTQCSFPDGVVEIKKMQSVLIDQYPAVQNSVLVSDTFAIKLARQQTEIFGFKHSANSRGKGVRIAVLDAGFNGLLTHPAFKHLIENNQLVAIRDFIRKKDGKHSGGSHGTAVLSCIAGMYKDIPLGLATDAEFLLARTEYNHREPLKEEVLWLAAAEWADSLGANIINSSLGYTYHRYLPHQMNGEESLVAKAAQIASEKGMLVVNAMGNDGSSPWHYLGTPADASDVLSVGGVDPFSYKHIGFSSYGPTGKGVLKPNVSAPGFAWCAKPNGSYEGMYGTSFATPLITGLAACIWQKHPDKSNQAIKTILEKSGHLYPFYNYAVGYGIPYFEDQRDEVTVSCVRETDSLFVQISKLPEERTHDTQLHIALCGNNQQLIYYASYSVRYRN